MVRLFTSYLGRLLEQAASIFNNPVCVHARGGSRRGIIVRHKS